MEKPNKQDYCNVHGYLVHEERYMEAQNKFIDYLLQSQQPKQEDRINVSELKGNYDPPCSGPGSVRKPLKQLICPECLTAVTQSELDVFGGLCEECVGF